MENDLLILPNDDDIKRFKEEITQEKFKHQLLLFENWLSYQKHLPQNFSKTFLPYFLRECKADLQKAKRKIEVYCYLQLTHEKFVKNREVTLDGDLRALDFMYTFPLPVLTPEGNRIGVIKLYDNDKFDLLSSCRYVAMLSDYLLYTEIQVVGEIYIFDMEFCQLRTCVKTFKPTFLQFLKMIFDAYPSRISQIFVIIGDHILEQAIQVGLNMCKSILPEKIKNRICMINSKADLKKYLPEKCLPSDYNGTQKSLLELRNGWRELMLKNADFYRNIGETRPRGQIPKYITKCDDTLGIDGSFRKLNID